MKMNVVLALLSSSFLTTYASADNAQVDITATCVGVDLHALNDAEKAFSSDQLMSAYNSVHTISDNGDYRLTALDWGHFDDSMDIPAAGDSGINSVGFHGIGACKICGGDGVMDDEICSSYFPEKVCDAIDFSTVEPDTLWEQLFVESLKKGPHAAFHTVEECNIFMTWTWETLTKGVATREEPPPEYKTAHIEVNCEEGSFVGLSKEEKAFSAKVVMTAYNVMHLNQDAGNYEIWRVEWEETTVADGHMPQPQKASYIGGYVNHFPDPNYDRIINHRTHAQVPELEEWANTYVDALHKSSYPLLNDLQNCTVKLELTEIVHATNDQA